MSQRRSGRVRRGSSTLRTTVSECGYGAVRTHGPRFKSYRQAHVGKLGYKRSLLAVALKLLRTILAMLRYNEP